jgi:hypothetical protein
VKTREQILEQRRKYWNENKERLNKKRKEWYEKNNDYAKKRQKEWRNKNNEHSNQWRREYRIKNLEKCKKQNLKTYFKYHEKYCLARRKTARKRRKEERARVINHYSNGKNACEICGITDIDVLSIDHINGGGGKHRKETHGQHIDHLLIMNNFPEGYRVLCMNCQFKERKRKNQFNPSNKINFTV